MTFFCSFLKIPDFGEVPRESETVIRRPRLIKKEEMFSDEVIFPIR